MTCPPCTCRSGDSIPVPGERIMVSDGTATGDCDKLSITAITFIVMIAYTVAFVAYLSVSLIKRLRSHRREQKFKRLQWSHRVNRAHHRREALVGTWKPASTAASPAATISNRRSRSPHQDNPEGRGLKHDPRKPTASHTRPSTPGRKESKMQHHPFQNLGPKPGS